MYRHLSPPELQGNLLGENLNPNPNNEPRRSVYLESAQRFYTPIPRLSRVAPGPILFLDEKKEDHYTHGIIYESLKPMFHLLRIMGIFPIQPVANGLFKVTPLWLAYSVGLFLLMVSYVSVMKFAAVKVEEDGSRVSTEGRFEEAVIDYLFTVYLVPIISNMIVWYESRKIATVLSDWYYFEQMYNKVTRKKMDIFLGNKPMMVSIVLPLLACGVMVVTHYTMERTSVLQILPYCYVNTITYLVGGYWFMQCDVLGKSATLLADDFQIALKHIGPSSHVADYRSLWILLSRLIRDVGNASGYTITFLCLYLFLIITLTIYGLLSQMQGGLGIRDVGLTVTALFALAFLFFICDEAHYASNCVRVQFQKKLLLVELSWMNDDGQQEINMFLRATEMSPTDMSLVGFFDVNRTLFKSLLATMVTYLVVLLQFQISLPEEATDTNSTSVT